MSNSGALDRKQARDFKRRLRALLDEGTPAEELQKLLAVNEQKLADLASPSGYVARAYYDALMSEYGKAEPEVGDEMRLMKAHDLLHEAVSLLQSTPLSGETRDLAARLDARLEGVLEYKGLAS